MSARLACAAILVASVLTAAPAFAQTAAPGVVPRLDGPRFRGGIALSGGGAFLTGWTLGMVGVDGRLGIQINDLLGVYLQPHFSLGSGTRGGVTGFTGFAGTAVMADVTLDDRFFAGAGGGVAVLNNPVAGELHFRVGAYPIVGRGLNRIRRKALMLGVDLRTYFAEGGITVFNVMGSIGYEAF